MPEYRVTYPGLSIKRADMVHMRGVEPSVCHVVALPVEPDDIAKMPGGTLSFLENGSPLFEFRNCLVRRLYARAPTELNGLEVEAEILDRRHAWSAHFVSGDYNVRTSSGETEAEYQKTWEELFAIVFEAMGEDPGGVILDLPDDMMPAPVVRWSATRCSDALLELADKAGCVICLTNDDTIVVEQVGSGPDYPIEEDARVPVIRYPISVESITPGVEVKFAPTRYEMWIRCKAVAINNTGRLSLIENADWMDNYGAFLKNNAPGSYTDSVGDGAAVGVKDDSWSVQTFLRQRSMLYRMYRVNYLWNATKFNSDGTVDTMTLPDGGVIRSIESILPLFERNLYEVGGAAYQPSDELPIVDNMSDVFDAAPPYVAVQKSTHDVAAWSKGDKQLTISTFGHEGFSEETGVPRIDFARGIIYFDQYIFFPSSNNDMLFDPGTVWLKATFNAIDEDTGALRRYRCSEYEGVTPARVVHYDDVYLYHVQVPGWDDRTYTNKDQLDNIFCPSLDGRNSSYGLDTTWMEWSGLKNYSVRGNVPQMRWVVGKGRVYTQGGRNMQHTLIAPTREA